MSDLVSAREVRSGLANLGTRLLVAEIPDDDSEMMKHVADLVLAFNKELSRIVRMVYAGDEILSRTEEGEREIPGLEEVVNVPSFVWVESFISLAGSFLYEREDSREPNDIDLVVRARESDDRFYLELSPDLRLKIDRVLLSRTHVDETHWIGTAHGPDWSYMPLWDLVLVPHEPRGEIRQINEPEFAEEFYKQHGWLNSPSLAYKAVYGEEKLLSGMTSHEKHNCNGIQVDAHLDCSLISELNAIPGIEIRASCEGHSEDQVAFIVFRLTEGDDRAEEVSRALSAEEGLYSLADRGTEGRIRIVVAGKTFFGSPGWKEWWNSLIEKVKRAVDGVRKLDLSTFRLGSLDNDLKDPKENYRALFADLRYLGNSGYPRLKEGKEWGAFKLDDILLYFATIVDALRRVYFPLIPPKSEERAYNTSYWQCYREAQSLMKTLPPSESEAKEWDKKRDELVGGETISKFVPFIDISKSEDEHIVCGVVYSPDEEDVQGDEATEEEIRKAAYDFMEYTQKFREEHSGHFLENVRILESYIAPADFICKDNEGNDHPVKKGSFVLTTRVLDEGVWQKIKAGELTGYSMQGWAS